MSLENLYVYALVCVNQVDFIVLSMTHYVWGIGSLTLINILATDWVHIYVCWPAVAFNSQRYSIVTQGNTEQNNEIGWQRGPQNITITLISICND